LSVNSEKYKEIITACEIQGEIILGSNLVLLSYYPLSEKFVKTVETDISWLKTEFKLGTVDNISISTASAILA